MPIVMIDKNGVVFNVNPEAFEERGQNVNEFVEKMKADGCKVLRVEP